MALEIVWTPQAEKGLNKVLAYLEEEWTEMEILQLENNLRNFLAYIIKYHEMFPETEMYKNVRKGLVDKNNYIIYRVNFGKGTIVLINFRGTKQKPII
jgi:plasmid stabilization system protein ParE